MTNNNLIKPQHLSKGDTIAVWSPSFPGGARYPRRLRRGIEALENLGFKVKLSRLSCNDIGYTAAEPEELALELHQLVMDESVGCIMTTMGGWLSARVLPHIDFELIKSHPKIHIGYSDIGSLLLAIFHKCNLITFHGPALLSELGEANGPWEYTIDSMLSVLMNTGQGNLLSPPPFWTDEFLAWETEDIRQRNPKGKAEWAGIMNGDAQGKLIGGCLPTLDLLYGTPYFPSLAGAILFLEQEGIQQDEFCAYLTGFKLKGMFDNINGLIFGRLSRPNYRIAPDIDFKNVVLDCIKNAHFPIAWNIDLGHTEPMLTLPIGIRSRLVVESEKVYFSFLDGAVG